MDKGDILKDKAAKLIVSSYSYDIKSDKRLLIPFINGEKIGFINHKKEVVVVPKYSMCYGNCFRKTDYIKVSKLFPYGFLRKSGYISSYVRPVFGVIDYTGKEVVPVKYFKVLLSRGCKPLFTVQNTEGQYGVINEYGGNVIPFGKYHYISGFRENCAIVSVLGVNEFTGELNTPYYGLINEVGAEITPLEYQKIEPFYNNFEDSTTAILHGEKVAFDWRYIMYRAECEDPANEETPSIQDLYELGYLDATGYELYSPYDDSYAKDEMRLSDEDIDNALDGEADAIWNID